MAAVNKEAILSKNLTIDQFLGLFLYSDATESESFDVPRRILRILSNKQFSIIIAANVRVAILNFVAIVTKINSFFLRVF